MESSFNLSLESKRPAVSQATPQYHVSLASFGLAFSLTMTQSTPPNVLFYEKINIPLDQATTRPIVNILPALNAKPKESWLSELGERIRDSIPAEVWAARPTQSAAIIAAKLKNA
jgi:hypothetical protein